MLLRRLQVGLLHLGYPSVTHRSLSSVTHRLHAVTSVTGGPSTSRRGYYAFTAAFRITCEDLYLAGSCTSPALSDLLPCLGANSGNVYLRTYGYDGIDPGVHAMVLFTLWVAFGGIALLLLIAHHREIAIWRTLKNLCCKVKVVEKPLTVAEQLQLAQETAAEGLEEISMGSRVTALELARGNALPAEVSYGAKEVLTTISAMLGVHKVYSPCAEKKHVAVPSARDAKLNANALVEVANTTSI